MKKKYPIIGDVRGRGAMQALEFVKPGTMEPNTEAQSAIIKYCLQKGVLLLSAGTYGNVIRLLPSLAITKDQVDVFLQNVRELAAVANS